MTATAPTAPTGAPTSGSSPEDDAPDICCLICGSRDYGDCGHLLVAIDQDYAECQGGVLYDDDSFQQLFETFFLVQAAANPRVRYPDPLVDELWQHWNSQNTEMPEDRSCDRYILSRLLMDAFERNGASSSYHVIEMGPGMTQQFVNVFARDPAEIVETTYSEFEHLMDTVQFKRTL